MNGGVKDAGEIFAPADNTDTWIIAFVTPVHTEPVLCEYPISLIYNLESLDFTT